MKKILLILSILAFNTNMQAMVATKLSHSEDIKNLIEKLDKKEYKVEAKEFRNGVLAKITLEDKSEAEIYFFSPNVDFMVRDYKASDPKVPDLKLVYISIIKQKGNDFYKLVITEEIEKLLKGQFRFYEDFAYYPERLATIKEKLVAIAKNTEKYKTIESFIQEAKAKSKKKQPSGVKIKAKQRSKRAPKPPTKKVRK